MSAKKDASRRNVAAVAREFAPRAISRLAELIEDADPRVAIDACKHVLDRAIGKPVALTADVSDKFDDFTESELELIIDNLKRQVAVADAADRGEPVAPQVTH